MIIKCQECGNNVDPGSRFCRTCGAPLDTSNPHKGENLVRVAVVFACLFPVVIVIIELVQIMVSRSISLFMIFDFLIVMSTLILFAFVYRGHQWAVIAVGLVLIIANLAELVIVFRMLSITFMSIAVAFFRVLWIVFGIYLMGSRDVLAFVKTRQEQQNETE
jgi:hypothetical protein